MGLEGLAGPKNNAENSWTGGQESGKPVTLDAGFPQVGLHQGACANTGGVRGEGIRWGGLRRGVSLEWTGFL